MAKKKNTMNKSARIRKYLAKHPSAKAAQVAKALNQYGVTPGLVYGVMRRDDTTSSNGRKPKKRTAGRPKGRKAGRPKGKRTVRAKGRGSSATTNASADALYAAAEFISRCGSLETAQDALQTVDDIRTRLNG